MIELVDPRGIATAAASALAERPARPFSRIGFLCNEAAHRSGPHFEGYTRVLEVALADAYGVREFRREIKPTLSLPATDEMLDRLSGCDGVINGLAK